MAGSTIGVIGAGAIGRAHADTILRSGFCGLAGIADPTEAGRAFARERDVPWFADHRELLAKTRPEAAILATPNDTHRAIALDCIAAGVAVLVEKPIASTVEDGEAIAAGVARRRRSGAGRSSPAPQPDRQARAVAPRGRRDRAADDRVDPRGLLRASGVSRPRLAAQHRRRPGADQPDPRDRPRAPPLRRGRRGAGPDLERGPRLRGRGHGGRAAAARRGCAGDRRPQHTGATPWKWDLAPGESPDHPPQPAPVATRFLAGTDGGLALLTLEHGRYERTKSWFAPISRALVPVERGDPYSEQLRHLFAVVRGDETPLITAADATRTLRATLAVHEAARTGCRVDFDTH